MKLDGFKKFIQRVDKPLDKRTTLPPRPEKLRNVTFNFSDVEIDELLEELL